MKHFPNPVSDFFNISTTNLNDVTILITDLNGKALIKIKSARSWESIDVNSFTNGTYIYTLIDKKGNIVFKDKFIKI